MTPITDEKDAMLLLVDDVPENIQLLGKILKTEGYSFVIATNGKETFRVIEQCIPDLILLDIMLPDTDGFEICRKLKEDQRTADIPIIFLTALADLEDKVRGFETGAVDYITKPFEDMEVIARVRTHIRLKKANEVIRKYSETLEESNTAKDKVFSVIAHDLHSHVSSVYSMVELLKMDMFDKEEKEELFEEASKNVKSTLGLLENLLCWARSQQNQIVYDPERFDIIQLINETAAQMSDIADAKSVMLRIPPSVPQMAFADKDMIGIVIRNLISNAVKFTHRFGTVTVSSAYRDRRILVTVSDTGIGIPPEDIGRLFRIDKKTVRQGTDGEKSTGLGLMLCREFAEKNFGEIWAESQAGKGSSFHFTVPDSGCDPKAK